MRFDKIDDGHDLGAPVEDVAQEAIDAAALSYAEDAGIDVEEHLRAQLASRGIAVSGAEDLDWLAERIRAGHAPRIGESDGSEEVPPA